MDFNAYKEAKEKVGNLTDLQLDKLHLDLRKEIFYKATGNPMAEGVLLAVKEEKGKRALVYSGINWSGVTSSKEGGSHD